MRSRRPQVLASASMLAITALVLGACGARTLATDDASRKISAKILEQQPGTRDLAVSCPADVKAEKGATFTCRVTAAGGFTGDVVVTQTDDSGTLSIRYPAPPGTGPPGTATTGSVPGATPSGDTSDPCASPTPDSGVDGGAGATAGAPPADRSRVVLFTRTAGYHHESIAPATAALRSALESRGFTVDATDDPSVFTPDGLQGISAIVFLETTGDVVNDDQQRAIESYVRRGGGWAGVHSATDTEYDWPFYGTLAGARFARHPEVQPATVVVSDHEHPSTAGLPDRWTRTDEWYDFRANPRPCVRVLATVDETSYREGQMGPDHPVVWCHRVGQGRSWYTALGHTDETWADPVFVDHVTEGIVSVTPTVPDVC